MSELTAYLAPEGFLPQLRQELSGILAVHERLVLTSGPAQPSVWAEAVWSDAECLTGLSIGQAAKTLRARQRNWWPYSWHLHRRHALIQEQLPHVSAKPLIFPEAPPTSPLGAYTLIDEQTLLFAARTSTPFANGAPLFAEPQGEPPPSRAYLKLWEVLTRIGVRPKPGELCLDLGASPGGWTWVLERLGAKVTAYDRAPLTPALLAKPLVTGVIGDAFQATPDKVGRIDWLFSDVICYPQRMLDLIRVWQASGLCSHLVCTIKFQGSEHYQVIPELLALQGGALLHLYHNKHELTFVWLHGGK